MTDSIEYRKIAEAALFTSGKAMTSQELAAIMGVESMGYVKSVMESLISEYSTRGGALEIKQIGDTYILGVRAIYAQQVSSLAGAPDITRPSLRILAYISKSEPMMQSSVVKAFGPSAYEHIKELTEKEFIKSTKEGRTKKIETTPKFREYFEL